MTENKGQNYLHGAVILTIAVVIIKILGFIYKVPLGNILGDEGFAHFNVAYNLYNVLLTLSTAGLPIALAKLVSESSTLGRVNQTRRTYHVALGAFVVLGTLGSAVMLLFPTELAVFMEDVEASQSIMAMAPSVLLVCIMSAYRGYTQGHSDMRPTSVSQVLEVAVKVFFGIGLVLILGQYTDSLPLLSAAAISGVSAGSLVACVYMAFAAGKRSRSYRLPEGGYQDIPDKHSAVLARLVRTGIPIALGSCVLSVITLVNTKLILARLHSGAGFSNDEAVVLFGVYSKALTLYNLPAAFITPLTVSIIPAISGYLAARNHTEATKVVESSLRIAAIIALPMAVGLSVLSKPIMECIYAGSAVQGPMLLAIMGIASFLVCLSLMTTAILQASGREKLPMCTMLVGGGLNIVLNWFLVGDPNVNIYGAPIGTLLCYVVMSGMNLYFICTKLPERPHLGRAFAKPLFTCLVMGAAAWIVYYGALSVYPALEGSRILHLLGLAAAIGVAVIVYAVLTVCSRAITLDDMKLLPKGEKIAKLLKIR